jgi:flagellar motor protein MotB
MRFTRTKRDASSGWAITFADLMGLLVSFFVMLTVLMSQNNDKFADSMRKAFKNEGGVNAVIIPMPAPARGEAYKAPMPQ